MPKFIDLTGRTFGSLTILALGTVIRGEAEKGYSQGKPVLRWLAKCECGDQREYLVRDFLDRNRQSCGCLSAHNGYNSEGIRLDFEWSKSAEYRAYLGMRQRCLNPKGKHYKNYGGRGIKISQRWLESFANFYEDMKTRPTPEHSLERLDVNGPYSKENCTWATWPEQMRNKRRTVRLTYQGRTQCLTDWAREIGINYISLSKRIKCWGLEKALSTPINKRYVHLKPHCPASNPARALESQPDRCPNSPLQRSRSLSQPSERL